MNRNLLLPASTTIETIEAVFAQMKQLEPGSHGPFIVDASGVDILTTPGVQLLLSLERTLDEQNLTLGLLNPTRNFKDTFTVLGLDAKIKAWSENYEK